MKNEKLLNYALESVRKGISVIPVGKNKIPLISWKEFQGRHASEEEIKSWFEKFDDPQIGFVTGKISNLLVIDIEKGGDPSFLPQDTTIVGTGGDGYHYYFKFEEGIMNKARIRPLIDWRGEGGYVVSPNSVSDKGGYSLLQEKTLLDFPKELFPAEEKTDIFDTAQKGFRHFEKKEIESYQGAGKGQRNDCMTKYIGYVLTQIHPADWETEALGLIDRANNMNVPPLSQKELLRTFESIKGIERRNNPLGHIRSNFESSSTISQESSNDIPAPIMEDNDEVMHIADVADSQVINQDEVFPLEMPCFDEAILGGVSPGDVITIAGQPGHGKTTLCQDWTMSMIRGDKKAKALWFSYEVLVSHVWKKFQEMGMTREDCAFIPLKHSTGNVAWIEAKIKEGKKKFETKVVFIDHLGFLLPKTNGIMGRNMSSNHSAFLTQIMRDLKTIAIQEEVIIFLPVHMKKPDYARKVSAIEDISGSAGPAQESDLVFLIEREKDKDKETNRLFTDVTKITLAKNRKTGTTVVGNFNMIKGRFSYDDSNEKATKIFDSYGKEEEVDHASEILKEEVKEEVKEVEKKEDLKDIMEDLWDKTP